MERQRLIRVAVLLGGLAVAIVIVMIGWFGLRATLSQVAGGLPALPAVILVHLCQLLVSSAGWRMLLPVPMPMWQMFRARWLREAVNSILPVANLGGSVVGARLLTRDGRIDTATAAASAAADITGEGISQVLFVLCALALATTLPHRAVSPAWMLAITVPLLAVVGGLVVAQAAGLLGWLERLLRRSLPRRFGRPFRGLQQRLTAIYAQPWRLVGDIAGNFIGWSLGAAEVWLLLRALGHPASPSAAYVIESLGLVARSMGFAVPAGLAAQETGFVLACGLFGIPHETGLALSLLKRAREIIVGVTGVLYWQWLERGVWLRAR
jgi:putative membrane protein